MANNIGIYEKFRCIVALQFDIDESQITPTTDFEDDLGADSLDLVDLIMSIDDEFEVDIPDEEICDKHYKRELTFQNAVNLIENAIRLKKASS